MKVQSAEEGLVFRLSEHTPDVIRQILLERGWTEYNEDDEENANEWNLWWRTQRFRRSEHAEIAHWQRLNHFPRTDAITRKDCLVRNLRRMKCVHGASAFDFHPLSYILPNEYIKFVSDYARESQKNEGKDLYWICKPTDLSRGRGIFVFQDLKDLNYDCPVIVQRYISSPLLISGYKFDLRIYVCVPSFHPLTIYIYQEGIVRFGTDKFDLCQLGNVFSHLTNTSINKYGPAYSTDKERVGPGCKWTLSQLRSFLRQMDNIDEMLLWQRITNIVTLTLATQAPTVPKSQSCFELFGFDILIDQNFKPWLLEVNFSPALGMDCQADFIAKHSMLNDLIDLLNFKASDAERGGKSYSECRSPSPTYFTPRRPQKYDRGATRKGQSHISSGRGTPTSLSPKTNTYTYSKPQVSKFSPLLLGKYKYSRSNAAGKKQSPQGTPRVSQNQLRTSLPSLLDAKEGSLENGDSRLPSIADAAKDTDETGNLDKMSDSGISCTSSIPRNLSSSSMASSQSSVDNQNRSCNDEDPYLDALEDRVSLQELSRRDAPEHTDQRTKSKNNAWTVGPDKDVITQTTKSAMNRPCSRQNERDKYNTPKRLARTQIRQQLNKSKTLPRIQVRNATPRGGYNGARTKTTALADGCNRTAEGNKLHPIAEATHSLLSKEALLDSITERDSETSTPTEPNRTPKMTPKAFRAKKNSSSAPNARTPVEWTPEHRFTILDNYQHGEKQSNASNGRTTKKKLASAYKSPYSIESTRITKTTTTNPWPRTRVGDFVLSFPWNEATRKASGTNFDMKTIIKEQQKLLKKLISSSKDMVDKNGTRKRRASAAISQSEALELSFMLKFEDKDANPLYFWGPQNPPLLSSVLS